MRCPRCRKLTDYTVGNDIIHPVCPKCFDDIAFKIGGLILFFMSILAYLLWKLFHA